MPDPQSAKDVPAGREGPFARYSRQWDLFGPPLRPCREDLDAYWRVVGLPGRVLILGVTPEFTRFPWPKGTHVIGADHARSMLHAVWPAHGEPERHAVCGDWRNLPLSSHSVDVALGDGCLTLIPFPDGYGAVAAELRRVIAPGGRFALRAFIDPRRGDTPGDVCDQLRKQCHATFHEFRFRLAIAVQRDPASGVRLGDAWDHWHAAGFRIADVARENRWREEVVATIDVWRDSEARYVFPSLDELREALSGSFEERSCEMPGYPFGDHCPLLTLEPRG